MNKWGYIRLRGILFMKKIVFFISLFFLSFFSFAEKQSKFIDTFAYNNVVGGIASVYDPESDRSCYNVFLKNYETPKYCNILVLACDKDEAYFWYNDFCKYYQDVTFFEDYEYLFNTDDYIVKKHTNTDIEDGIMYETTYYECFDE